MDQSDSECGQEASEAVEEVKDVKPPLSYTFLSNTLKSHPLFEWMSNGTFTTFNVLCHSKESKRVVKRGHRVRVEGDCMYLVISGEFGYFRTAPDVKNDFLMERYTVGDVLEVEHVMSDQNRFLDRQFYYECMKSGDLLVIPKTMLRSALLENPRMSYSALAKFILYSKEASVRRLSSLVMSTAREKVLLFMEEYYGKPPYVIDDLRLSILGRSVGSSREMVSRIVKDLRSEGVIAPSVNPRKYEKTN